MSEIDFNHELRKVIDLAIKDTGVIENTSLKELFTKKINEIGITQNNALKLLNMELKTLNSILDNTAKRVDVINIIKLAHFLGLSINEIMKVYISSMSSKQIGSIQRAKEASYITENFDINSLEKIGFISSKDINNLKSKITNFFGLKTIYDYSETKIYPAFSRSKRTSDDKVRDFWLKSAFAILKGIDNPYPYNREKLIDLIPKIRPYTRNENLGLTLVAKALYLTGVTIIYQPSIANLQVKGATFVVNDKPCIVISDLNKRYPTLWFVLLHELFHILYDLNDIKETSFHLSGDYDLFALLLDEEGADDFAREYLLSDDRLKFIKDRINAQSIVQKYAKKWSIHPSIIYAIYCYNYNDWGNPVSKLIPKTKKSLYYLNTNPFKKETLLESIQHLKQKVFNI